MLTTGGLVEAFSQKTKHYPTLTRMMGSYVDAGMAMRDILNTYNWTTHAYLFHEDDEKKAKGHSDCALTIPAIYRSVNKSKSIEHKHFDENDLKKEDYLKILKELKRITRSKYIINLLYV